MSGSTGQPIKAVLFDTFGTVVDALRAKYEPSMDATRAYKPTPDT